MDEYFLAILVLCMLVLACAVFVDAFLNDIAFTKLCEGKVRYEAILSSKGLSIDLVNDGCEIACRARFVLVGKGINITRRSWAMRRIIEKIASKQLQTYDLILMTEEDES